MACYKPLIRGSPPRMRGKVHLHPSLQVHLGITPAYAGKRRTPAAQQQPGRDHPRMCGEKLLDRYWIGTGLGDTKDHPRTCGEKHAVCHVYASLIGITPAHAGKSFTVEKCRTGNKDHPRTCGEKLSLPFLVCIRLGSPPHMRGKGGVASVLVRFLGITPAHAGKSRLRASTGR